jgi:hypothetical protein
MAGNKTGTWSIVQNAREITRLYTKYGAVDLESRTSTEFLTCVQGLVACYQLLQNTDDFLLQVDRTLPAGPEDQVGP